MIDTSDKIFAQAALLLNRIITASLLLFFLLLKDVLHFTTQHY